MLRNRIIDKQNMKVMKNMKKQSTTNIIYLDFSNLNKNSKCVTKLLPNIQNITLQIINPNITKLNLVINPIWKEIINTFILMKNKIMKRDLTKTIRIIYITLKNTTKEKTLITNLRKQFKMNMNNFKILINITTKGKSIKIMDRIYKKR